MKANAPNSGLYSKLKYILQMVMAKNNIEPSKQPSRKGT